MYNPYDSNSGYDQSNLEHPQPHRAPQQQSSAYGRYDLLSYADQSNQYQQPPPQQQSYQPQAYQQQSYRHAYKQQQYQVQPHAQQFQDQAGVAHTQLVQFLPHQLYQHQPQHGDPQSPGSSGYGNFFSDPTASMAAQFAKSSLGLSNQYIQQNFGLYMPMAGELKYYFKVSNSYVWHKLLLIIFPYRHPDWSRVVSSESGGVSLATNGGVVYAPASEDVNAPDLYIPLMAFVTYVLLWALFLGLRGDFHPEVFGYLASRTLACSLVDIALFKVGLYLLNCSTHSSLWDLVAFSGYKYVPVIILLFAKQIFVSSWILFSCFSVAVVANLSVFLMRSLKFMVLPIGASDNLSISNGQRRIRLQFLLLYSVVFQFMIVLFMSW